MWKVILSEIRRMRIYLGREAAKVWQVEKTVCVSTKAGDLGVCLRD